MVEDQATPESDTPASGDPVTATTDTTIQAIEAIVWNAEVAPASTVTKGADPIVAKQAKTTPPSSQQPREETRSE
jgi:hypothetical protein